MATRPRKSQAKKPAKQKVVAAKVAKTAVTGDAAPAPQPPLANALKPDEQLTEPAVALESAVDTIEKSLKAALPAARAMNKKLVDIAQTNVNSSLELARDLAGAKTPLEAMRLGLNYWHDNADVFQSQALELRTLSAEFLTTASEPFRAHVRRLGTTRPTANQG